MAKLEYTLLTNDPNRLNPISTKFGANVNEKFTDKEIGKLVKDGTTGGNQVLAADGDEIEGWVDSISPGTMDGFTWGGAAKPGTGQRVEAKVSGTALVLNDLVVAGPQAAIGTASLPVVKKGTPATYKWKVINLFTGAGAAGSTVLLVRIA